MNGTMKVRGRWLFVLVAALVALAGGCELVLGTHEATVDPGCCSGGAGGGSAAVCMPGDTQPCYTGQAGTEDAGTCMDGIAACTEKGEWGTCQGETTPKPRSCASTMDVACIGKDNCTQWAELFGNLAGADATAVGVDGMGNVFVLGVFAGSIALPNPPTLTAQSESDLFLLKLDPMGTPLWGKEFTGGVPVIGAINMAVDAAGDVIIGGSCAGSYSFGGISVGPGIWVTKLSGDDGSVQWAKGLSVNCATAGCAFEPTVGLTPQGDIVIGGTFAESSLDFGDGPIATTGPSSGFVAQLRGSDGSGKMVDGGWNQILCNSATDLCQVNGIAVDGMGNVLVAATFQGTVNLGKGAILMGPENSPNVALGKLAPGGSPTWVRQLGDPNGANVVQVLTLSIDGEGGPILNGTFDGNVDFGSGTPVMGPTGMGMNAGFVAHYDQADVYLFALPLKNASVNAAAGDATGNIFVVGSFTGPLNLGGPTPLMISGAGDTDVFVAKLSPTGSFQWNKAYGMSGTMGAVGKQAAAALALTSEGAPIVAGFTANPIDFGLGTLTPAATMGGEDAFVAELSP